MKSIAYLISFLVFLMGCSQNDATSLDEKKKSDFLIYTSIYPMQYFAERIGGDAVTVKSIVPPGSDGHTYEPTSRELIQIAESDLLVYNGSGYEGFIEKAKQSLTKQDVVFVNASKELEHTEQKDLKEKTDEHNHQGKKDPHIWLDPILSIQLAQTIKEEMIKEKPESKAKFESNFQTLKRELLNLNAQYVELAKHAKRKEFIVAHSAYDYWEERYGFKQIAVAGNSPSHEPSQKEAQAIIQFAHTNNISYILFERNVPSDVTKMIQKEVDAEILYLNNLETLTQAQMKANEDYMSIMKKNLETLRKALN